jgi:hypothetical protein
MKRFFFVLILVLSPAAFAYLPPVSELLSEVFSGRKSSEGIELQFRHVVQVREGESVEVVEIFTGNRSGGVIQWQIAGQPSAYSDWNQKEYLFRNNKSIPSRTNAFIDVFLAGSGSEYLDRLLRERFIRRDQLLIFKPGYSPTGDPKTWETKASYLHHDDVYLQRIGSEFAVAISGMSEGEQKRAVYITKSSKSLARIEWGVGSENASWDFSQSAVYPGLGRLPRIMNLVLNGVTRVSSTLASAKPVRRDAIATVRASSRQPSSSAPPSPSLEEAVRLIVRYR